MADVSTASVPEVHEADPPSECVFLDVLPPELRLLIYEIAFHGSRVHASLFDFKRPHTQAPALILRRSSHFNFLLSCRQIYNEALATFWSMTVLEFAQPLERSQILTSRLPTEVKPDVYSYWLCKLLPEALSMNIRHIRGMILPELRGEFVKYNSGKTATALLSDFKNLATCDISPTLARHRDLYQQIKCIHYSGNKGVGRFTASGGQDSRSYLADRYGIDITTEIVFLSKTLVKIPTSEKDTHQILNKGLYRKTRFWNLSAGTTFAVQGHNVDDEGHGPSVRRDRRVEWLV